MSWIEILLGYINKGEKQFAFVSQKRSQENNSPFFCEFLTKIASFAYNKISLMVEIKLNSVIMRV